MYIDKFKKIVIKIGSSILIDEKGKPKKIWLKEFAKEIKILLRKKKQIVIVSSGAIAMGCKYLGMKKNGLLILSEKTHFDNKFRNQTLLNLHHQFKFNNGYTKMEISRKRDALEGVLITDLEKDHFQRLQKIGYTEIKKVMSNLNFFTLIAQKK